jgi:uncharacterized protein
MMSKIVLIAGGTGLIGPTLANMLQGQHYQVRILTRTPKAANQFRWDPAKGTIDDAALQGISAVINLAGAGIADKRWTPNRKREIIESRVQAAAVLEKAFVRLNIRPEVYVAASAIGYYGDSGEQLMTETDAPVGTGFMVDCCQQWEKATEKIRHLGIRTTTLRIGVVLAKEGGALAEILKPLRFGLGAYFSTGQAWWSWIHRDDVCRMMIWCLENPNAFGVYNAVAPQPARGINLVHEAAHAMQQPALFLPAPKLALRIMLGEMSAVILNSNNVSAAKVVQEGFQFHYPTLPEAMRSILAPKQAG